MDVAALITALVAFCVCAWSCIQLENRVDALETAYSELHAKLDALNPDEPATGFDGPDPFAIPKEDQ